MGAFDIEVFDSECDFRYRRSDTRYRGGKDPDDVPQADSAPSPTPSRSRTPSPGRPSPSHGLTHGPGRARVTLSPVTGDSDPVTQTGRDVFTARAVARRRAVPCHRDSESDSARNDSESDSESETCATFPDFSALFRPLCCILPSAILLCCVAHLQPEGSTHLAAGKMPAGAGSWRLSNDVIIH